MVRRQKPEDAQEAQDTSESHDAHVAAAAGQQEREKARLHKMLADERARQDKMRKADDIVFTRGLDQPTKEAKITALGYTLTQAIEIMLDKETVDQHGEVSVRPGFTREQRGMVAGNIRKLESVLQRIDGPGNFAPREEKRRSAADQQPEGIDR